MAPTSGLSGTDEIGAVLSGDESGPDLINLGLSNIKFEAVTCLAAASNRRTTAPRAAYSLAADQHAALRRQYIGSGGHNFFGLEAVNR